MDEVASTSNASKSKRPPGTGRKKIEIKKIENKRKKWVTLSKRKKGLFSKAAQLSRLGREDIGVLVISEQGRAYTSENADAIFQQYLSIKDQQDRQKEDENRVDAADRESMVLEVVKKPQLLQQDSSNSKETRTEGDLRDLSNSEVPRTEGKSDIKFVFDLNKFPEDQEQLFLNNGDGF